MKKIDELVITIAQMEDPKSNCLLCIEDFFKSPITASKTKFLELSNSVAALMNNSFEISKKKELSIKCPAGRNDVMMNFSQIISCLEFIADIVREENKVNSILEECRKVAFKRIKFCVDIIEETSFKNQAPISESGQFLRWMDSALDHIAKIDVDDGRQLALITLKDTKSIYEHILIHAMSIAQICLNEDSKAINGSCRSVLDILEDLQNELNKSEPNKAMMSLFVDDASNKLCSLERKVDVAVLRLCLFVVSKYRVSLDNLHRFCEINCNKKFDEAELDDIITDFDLHIDRIFQIGLFAIFCSSNLKSATKIQNCLASLEFLEPELVPAMKMVLKDGTLVHRTSALIYKNYWICEAERLKTLVYEIIDPSAFCKVMYDEVIMELDNILQKNEDDKDFRKSLFVNILNVGRVLVDFTLTVVRIEAITDEEIKDTIRKCNIITSEIDTAIAVLDDNNSVTYSRILKRCKIFQAELKKLLSLLNSSNNLCNKENDNCTENNQSILNPSDEKENIGPNKLFTLIQSRGKELFENRSIMYRTPNKCYTYTDFGKGGSKAQDSFLQRLSNSQINFSFRSLDENPSFSTKITDILMNLSKLSTSVVGEN